MEKTHKKKIMLVWPNTRWYALRYWHSFPYVLGLFTAVLKDKYYVNVLDANLEDLSFDQVKGRIKEYNPDFFCISCLSVEYDKIFRKMAELAKMTSPGVVVIAGGVSPTIIPEFFLEDKNFDYIIMGEGEYRLPNLLDHLERDLPLDKMDGLGYRKNGKNIIQKVTNYIENLDELPLPCYDHLNFQAYVTRVNKFAFFVHPRQLPYAWVVSSRGCSFNCIYCNSKQICGPKIRYRSAESVLEEIDLLVKKHGVRDIIFMDDNFYLDKIRVIKILNGLIERDYGLTWKSCNAAVYALDEEILKLMKKSGCYQIILAIESGTQEVLKIMRKPLNLSKVREIVGIAKSLGFELAALFMIGTPGETWEQIRKTIRFAEELDLDYVSFNITTPLPGTELYEIAKREKLIEGDFDFRSINSFGMGKITTKEFTPRELEFLRAFEWDRINFKSEADEIKIARMNGITLDQVKEWRISTRRGFKMRQTEMSIPVSK